MQYIPIVLNIKKLRVEVINTDMFLQHSILEEKLQGLVNMLGKSRIWSKMGSQLSLTSQLPLMAIH